MTLDEVRQIIARQAQAWIDQDIELALPDFAPDAIFQSPGGRWQGRDQIREEAIALFAKISDIQITVGRIMFDERHGAVEWTWEETRRSTNKRHYAEDAIIFEIIDGQIVYWREYVETTKPAAR